jgi:nucleotide-binding universal stress UspA family protein
MLSIRRVLFPTDHSSSAEHAYTCAVRLAAAVGAELHVLHVVLPDIDEQRATDEESQPAGGWPAGLLVHHRVKVGESPASEIVAYCQDEDIDVVVVGTLGRTGLRRLLLGSVAERVVREAPCPVMTVPLRSPGQSVARILAAVDLSEFSRSTLAHARGFAELHGAHLDVLHVIQEVIIPSAYGPELAPMVTPDLEEQSRRALDQLIADVGPGGGSLEAHVSVGYPATEILRFADEYGVDLIVMATHGLTGLEHFLIGSVTEKVVRKAPCPVFTVRSFGKSVVAAETA